MDCSRLMRGVFALCLASGLVLRAQQVTAPRIVRTIDDNSLGSIERQCSSDRRGVERPGTNCGGNTDGARPADPEGESAEQDAALEQFLAALSDPRSPQYQQWLTPEEFGERFGPARQDVDAIVKWLQNRGFAVNRVGKGRRTIEFSGTARQMEVAFHTEIHSFDANGERHLANATDLAIPDALAAVVAGVRSMHDFRLRPHHHVVAAGSGVGGENNRAGGGHAIVPYDFATIYNIAPLWNASFDGSGQTIAVVSHSNVKLSDITDFRSQYGLPANNPSIIVDGIGPRNLRFVRGTRSRSRS